MSTPGKSSNHSLPAFAPWPKLLRSWAAWERLVREEWRDLVSSVGLSDQQWLLLWFAGEADSPGRPQTELADDLNVSPAQVCLLLEDLRRRELMAATRCAPDRRRQFWQPTAAGRQLLEECDHHLRRWQATRLPSESAATIEPICQLLAQITPLPSARSRADEKEAA